MERKYIDLKAAEYIAFIVENKPREEVKQVVDSYFDKFSENCVPVDYIREKIKIGKEWEEALEDWEGDTDV